ncbi:MAG: ParB N-terminal domain-containing protein [Clostridiales Family XIII bacterium]|jgi:ParB family chromosome partitioning protein|nr:ParB N-terminal domain-containing protein [Clostridiales Family XIII bacterium]
MAQRKLANPIADLFNIPITEDDIRAVQGKPPLGSTSKDYQVIAFDLMDDNPDNHFKLHTEERKDDFTESIRQHGIMQPIILRGYTGEKRYHILAGHNRKYSGMDAGLTEAPAVIKWDISDEEAYAYVMETNILQRSFKDLLPSEKAEILHYHADNMFSQGKRNDIKNELLNLENCSNSNEVSTLSHDGTKLRTEDKIGLDYGLRSSSVARYLRVYILIDELKKMLDEKTITLTAAVQLSYLSEKDQKEVAKQIDLSDFKLDQKKADLLRSCSDEKKLDEEKIYLILSGEKTDKPKKKPNRTPTVKIDKDRFSRHFSGTQKDIEVQEIVGNVLDAREVFKAHFGRDLTGEEMQALIENTK